MAFTGVPLVEDLIEHAHANPSAADAVLDLLADVLVHCYVQVGSGTQTGSLLVSRLLS